MRYTALDIQTLSTDNVHTLYGKIYNPIGTPKAVLQILHGMSEHMELYDEFMSKLAENGYAALIYDQLGHGKTAGEIDNLGFFANENGSDILVKDAHLVAEEFLQDYKGLKHILLGHSMGSFIARVCCEEYPDMCDMLILLGTGGHQKTSALGLALTQATVKVHNEEYRSEFAQKLFLDFCNILFREDKNKYAWTTRDVNVQKQHTDDKYYNFVFSVKAMQDVVKLAAECNTEEWYLNCPKNLPILLLSGEKDPVGEYGLGVFNVYRKLYICGSEDVSFKLYGKCRHELLHEQNKDDVMNDILTWLNYRLKQF